jgi:SAM-dependent methyltransferase
MYQSLVKLGVISAIISYLEAKIDPSKEGILEIGCGSGEFGAHLKSEGFPRYQGVDADPVKIALAKRITGMSSRFHAKSADDTTIMKLKSDIVICRSSSAIDIIPSGKHLIVITEGQTSYDSCCLALSGKFANGAHTFQHGNIFVTYGRRA